MLISAVGERLYPKNCVPFNIPFHVTDDVKNFNPPHGGFIARATKRLKVLAGVEPCRDTSNTEHHILSSAVE